MGLSFDEFRSLRRLIWPDADPGGGGRTPPVEGGISILGTTLRRVVMVLVAPEPKIQEQIVETVAASQLQFVNRIQEQRTVEFSRVVDVLALVQLQCRT